MLNKQPQRLEKHLHASSVSDKGPKSNIASHTTSGAFQYETPTFASKADPTRLDDQYYMHTTTDGPNRWNSPSVSYDSTSYSTNCSPSGNHMFLRMSMSIKVKVQMTRIGVSEIYHGGKNWRNPRFDQVTTVDVTKWGHCKSVTDTTTFAIFPSDNSWESQATCHRG
uniref:ATP-dependent DNA helicase Q-like 4A isoform X1 n=1 Tax=Tanacetum cinerariifolium TaxID=118510 RepID=A0A6L2KUJ6_TANCI|nr:ATP-dependent DNA helicase Q-like 4A isoform X1 [Tanacetum cinerariifolium]